MHKQSSNRASERETPTKTTKKQSILDAAKALLTEANESLPTVIISNTNIGKGSAAQKKKKKYFSTFCQYHIQWLQHLNVAVRELGSNVDAIITEHNQHFINHPKHMILAGNYELWFRHTIPDAIRQNQDNNIRRELMSTVKQINTNFDKNEPKFAITLLEQLYAAAIGQWQLHPTPKDKLSHLYPLQQLIWQHFLQQGKLPERKGWKIFSLEGSNSLLNLLI